MGKYFLIGIFVSLIVFLVPSVFGQMVDSDGDGVLDEFDNCPGTNPNEGMPIILKNPEFLGCSCSQIFEIMRNEYCKDVYCHPNRPLEIRNRAYSSRPNPCPPPMCEGGDLYEYVVDEIPCVRGVEASYECEEIVTVDSELCVDDDVFLDDSPSIDVLEDSFYDVLVKSYLKGSVFVDILGMRNKSELMKNEEAVLNRVNVDRVVDFDERIINDNALVVADVSFVVKPDSYYSVDNFVLIERVIGDISNKNIVVHNEGFFDEDLQVIVWEVDELKDKFVFGYRITPGSTVDFDFLVQGDVNSFIFSRLVLPLLMLIGIIAFVVFWIINLREKNNVFK